MSLVIMMGIGARAELAARLIAHGWNGDAPAAIVCAASTPDEWVWTGVLSDLGDAPAPVGAAGVLVIGEVVRVRDQLLALTPNAQLRNSQSVGVGSLGVGSSTDLAEAEVKYGRH
jgi:siroheme synthase